MLNALFPEIPWEQIKCVGFDLDGTLYDEFDFIRQVYPAILQKTELLKESSAQSLLYMLNRWLEKGSSYNRIFSETFSRFGLNQKEAELFIAEALKVFRTFQPELKLNMRNTHLLEHFRDNYHTFLISDGSKTLQLNKFRALKLETFFAMGNVIFTGDWGAENYKPNPAAFHKLGISFKSNEIVYFGDRTIDKEFCNNLGIHFQRVYNMVPV